MTVVQFPVLTILPVLTIQSVVTELMVGLTGTTGRIDSIYDTDRTLRNDVTNSADRNDLLHMF